VQGFAFCSKKSKFFQSLTPDPKNRQNFAFDNFGVALRKYFAFNISGLRSTPQTVIVNRQIGVVDSKYAFISDIQLQVTRHVACAVNFLQGFSIACYKEPCISYDRVVRASLRLSVCSSHAGTG